MKELKEQEKMEGKRSQLGQEEKNKKKKIKENMQRKMYREK